MYLLEAKGICKSFGHVEVLKGISLSVEENQVVSIIGPSGSGKSTLLRCLTQLETADGGDIAICGDRMMWMETDKNGGEKAVFAAPKTMHDIILKVGLVFQNFQLFPHWSVLKNIADAPMTILGKSREEAEAAGLALLRRVDLADKAGAYPCQLSGGQQQRVAIARALALSPKILFFDEPTSALDPELIGAILKVIKELAAEKMTMVIVTHEMTFAKEISDRIVFMDNGEVVAEGRPEMIFGDGSHPRIQAFLNVLNR